MVEKATLDDLRIHRTESAPRRRSRLLIAIPVVLVGIALVA
ncbi:MAG: hypothetical protein QOJ98_736, partial [Acidobacteriota bacterium]|nr:hypothetical protein [Acidobacteriota bacterium]